MSEELTSPFPYFGGKSKITGEVWDRFGEVRNYVEPFCGSCSMLLARPNPKGIEVVNDINGLLVNVWRAIKYDPDEVFRYADSPSSTIDLKAKHNYVYREKSDLVDRMESDPDHFDPKVAGYWLYAQSTLVGGRGIFQEEIGRRKPSNSAGGSGIHSKSLSPVDETLRLLSERLRSVKIFCGDWSDCLTKSYTYQDSTAPRTTAVFLDPPYVSEDYYEENYEHSNEVFWDVVEWCEEHEEEDFFRIALCGYTGHGVSDRLSDWERWVWDRQCGYAEGQRDRQECVWFSPTCRGGGESILDTFT